VKKMAAQFIFVGQFEERLIWFHEILTLSIDGMIWRGVKISLSSTSVTHESLELNRGAKSDDVDKRAKGGYKGTI
jgi:hypothetical protein